MLFSVIIPVYNVEKYLRACLDSMLNQSFSCWEAICVNDGSTDGSAVILKEYAARDKRFRVVEQSNAGLSVARNIGMKHASGDYVLFLDSDDWLETNALETLAGIIDGEDMICFSGRRYLELDGRYLPTDQLEERTYQSGMDYYNENALQHRDFAFVCVVLRLYKRSFLKENELRFKEGFFHEDNLFTPLACYYARIVKVINRSLYDYRVRDNSITTTYNEKRLRDMLGMANELAAFFIAKTGFEKTIVYRAITHHYQMVFKKVPRSERHSFKRICDWNCYRIVSGTKPRHIVNYWKNKLALV